MKFEMLRFIERESTKQEILSQIKIREARGDLMGMWPVFLWGEKGIGPRKTTRSIWMTGMRRDQRRRSVGVEEQNVQCDEKRPRGDGEKEMMEGEGGEGDREKEMGWRGVYDAVIVALG